MSTPAWPQHCLQNSLGPTWSLRSQESQALKTRTPAALQMPAQVDSPRVEAWDAEKEKEK